MGKTHRNVYSGSNSVSYHGSHIRGFAKDKKQIHIEKLELIIILRR